MTLLDNFLKKLWNMKMTVILIVIGALWTIPDGSVKGLEDLEIRWQKKTIHTTTILKSARILRRILDTWGDLLSSKLQWKTFS